MYKNLFFNVIGYTVMIFFILYILSDKTSGENPKHARIMKNMDSIIRYQKTQLDTLMWYNQIGYKVK